MTETSTLTDAQDKQLIQALDAAESCRKRAEVCARHGLTVLAREYDYFAKSLKERVEWQRRALSPSSIMNQADGSAVIESNSTQEQST